MGRGDFKYLLLDALKDRPMHGYEIMKVMNDKYGGFYTPSPGLVYPTLQMLEDLGHVTSKTENGKKIYSTTEEGVKFLTESKPALEAALQRRQRLFKGPKADFHKEARRLGRLLFISAARGEVTEAKAEEISKILADTTQRIGAILSG
jgi:DNA-binding PadR family transcriptional regulator